MSIRYSVGLSVQTITIYTASTDSMKFGTQTVKDQGSLIQLL